MESKLIHHVGYVKAHLAHNRKRLFINTGVKVPKSAVDGKGFVKPKANSNWQNLNQQILVIKRRLDDAITKDLQEYKHIDIDRIRIALMREEIEDEAPKETNIPLSKMLSEFIANQPKMNRGLRWRFELLGKIINKNDKFCKEVKLPYLNELLDKFRVNVNANTASTRYKNFKRFITWSKDNGYPLPMIEWKKLTKPTFKPDFVFLTDERIQQLVEYKPKSEFEEKIKNIFLVLIYTGMRYSDYESLQPINIHDGCIDKVAKKTNIRFKVPINKQIAHVLKNPPRMCGNVFNKGVRELGQNIGWSEMVKYQKDISEFEKMPFYDMLCSSVGRHTFATRALLAGIPHNVIMGWCGWANSTMLFYYSEKLKMKTTDWMDKLK